MNINIKDNFKKLKQTNQIIINKNDNVDNNNNNKLNDDNVKNITNKNTKNLSQIFIMHNRSFSLSKLLSIRQSQAVKQIKQTLFKSRFKPISLNKQSHLNNKLQKSRQKQRQQQLNQRLSYNKKHNTIQKDKNIEHIVKNRLQKIKSKQKYKQEKEMRYKKIQEQKQQQQKQIPYNNSDQKIQGKQLNILKRILKRKENDLLNINENINRNINDNNNNIQQKQKYYNQQKIVQTNTNKKRIYKVSKKQKQVEQCEQLQENNQKILSTNIIDNKNEFYNSQQKLKQAQLSYRIKYVQVDKNSPIITLKNNINSENNRIHILKKTKDYQFYDSLVHDLLMDVKTNNKSLGGGYKGVKGTIIGNINSNINDTIHNYNSLLTQHTNNFFDNSQSISISKSKQLVKKPSLNNLQKRYSHTSDQLNQIKRNNSINSIKYIIQKQGKHYHLDQQKQMNQLIQLMLIDQNKIMKKMAMSLSKRHCISTGSLLTNNNLPSSSTNNSQTFFLKKRDSMIFRLSQMTSDTVYDKKITSYIQFLYKVNFSNNIYVDLGLGTNNMINYNQKSLPQNQNNQFKKINFKVKIGKGNNSELIKSIVKRRFWLEITNDKIQSNFIWTQLTQKDIHQWQKQGKKYKSPEQKQSKKIKQKHEKIQKKNTKQINFQKPKYKLKNKFSIPLYSEQSNLKILHPNDVQQSSFAFSQSYMGLRSPHTLQTPNLISNHLPSNYIIGSKKVLWMLMKWYYSQFIKIDPFIYLPETYHIIPGDKQNQGLKKFKQIQLDKRNKIWIVKPGENTNRGNGIQVMTTGQIQNFMKNKQYHKNGDLKTFIVQKYIKPFLYQNRKFDIRHYLLLTSVNGILKAYWYKQGYIRTSSQKFDLQQLQNQFIHLTNDAIQKQSQNYGKYQPGNKISYTTFQRYLDNNFTQKRYNFKTQILEQMKKITTDVIRAGFMFIDPQRKQGHNLFNFQLYGMDFMIDHKFKPYLIEINANPCLQTSCPLLENLIPICLQHTFRVALDPLLPPNDHYSPSNRYQLCDRILDKFKYELIFDQKHQGKQIRKKYKDLQNKFQLNGMQLEPDQDFFEDDGQIIKDQKIFQQQK